MLVYFMAMVLMGVSVFGAPKERTTFSFQFLMPDVQPKKPDTYLCHGIDAGEEDVFITAFSPRANKDVAHHILLYGCEEPGSTSSVWNCGEMAKSDSKYDSANVCARGSQILYAWAMDAPNLHLPKDVAFKVGGNTGVKTLVLQVHYKNVSSFVEPENATDASGLILTTTEQPQKRRAGVYLMVTGGEIPGKSIEYLEAACAFPDAELEIHPFAYRTHAHKLGRVISGYRVRDQHWEEIGRQDPRKPQMFYNVTSPNLTVRQGDILASRCTMENNYDHNVRIGPTQNDEMCNLYIMYYVDGDRLLEPNTCYTQGAPRWYWEDFPDQQAINLAGVPATVSVVPGDKMVMEKTISEKSDDGFPGLGSHDLGQNDKTGYDAAVDDLLDEAVSNMEPDEVEQLVAEALSPQRGHPGTTGGRQTRLGWLTSHMYGHNRY